MTSRFATISGGQTFKLVLFGVGIHMVLQMKCKTHAISSSSDLAINIGVTNALIAFTCIGYLFYALNTVHKLPHLQIYVMDLHSMS